MSTLRILVSAIGGDVGQAIVKAVRIGSLPAVIEGADSNVAGIGGAFVDKLFELPPARQVDAYLEALDTLIQKNTYDIVVPASEAEISVLGENQDRLSNPECILMQPKPWIDLFADKLAGMQNLADHVPLVRFADASNAEDVEKMTATCTFPMVVKSRRGFGSKTVGYAKNTDQLNDLVVSLAPAVAMEYISDKLGEYSVGVFRIGDVCKVLPVKRTLGNVGCTWYGEVVNDPDVTAYAEKIAVASNLQGAANIQVRKNEQGVFLLEINPRLSSLAAARASAGFNDVEWWMRMHLGLPIRFPENFEHVVFQRYFAEMIDRGNGWESPASWIPNNTK